MHGDRVRSRRRRRAAAPATLAVPYAFAGSPRTSRLSGSGKQAPVFVAAGSTSIPTVGPPGIVVIATGTGFAPGSKVRLTWSVGETPTLPIVQVDATGRFRKQVLVFHNDLTGPRDLRRNAARRGQARVCHDARDPAVGRATRLPDHPPPDRPSTRARDPRLGPTDDRRPADDLQAMRLRQCSRRPVLRIVRRVPRVGGPARRRRGRRRRRDRRDHARHARPRAADAAGAAPASAAWGAPYGDPIPNPVRPSAPEPDTYDEDGDGVPDGPLVRCPACGIANPSNRTFCQSCGTTLAAAARVEEPAPEQVAAAVAWTPTPPPSPVTGASDVGARGRPGAVRGIPSWVIGVAVVGLLVGVAIVLAGLALRGKPPGDRHGAVGRPHRPAPPAARRPGSSASAAPLRRARPRR